MLVNIVKQLPVAEQLKPKVKKLMIKLPSLALKPVNLLPDSVQQQALTQILTKVLIDALENEELTFLAEKWLHIDIIDVPFKFYVSVNENNKLLIKKELNLPADVCFCGDTHSILQLMSRNIDPDTLFFQRKLLVTGDTELGLEIKNFLDDMNLAHLPLFIQKSLQQYSKL